nr:transglutaminase family protein [Planctomycetota bacterium]
VGHVLPLAFRDEAWVSGDWFLRQEHCFLMPGDSAIGYRLPLDSQPWTDPKQREQRVLVDPSGMHAALPPRPETRIWPGKSEPLKPPADDSSAKEIVRSALCVQPRDGILRIFLPPLDTAGPFVDLVAAIERAAERCELPVLLEGYPAPHHPDLERMAITPDPGVLEVNVPPVASWGAQVEQLRSLYEDCHQEHLAADKFDVDGRHTGTGGGCHVVIGGATPADSPWLRRPDVLGSLLRYWLNHPSLTYVFSGSFVGPTSQAPRLDEARQDAVAELELALRQVEKRDEPTPPWLVDRVFRNILIDLTGNTHRAEVCIDKLFSPDGPTGRLGLVELRSFEMPPHWQMASAQHLLVRALVAGFWNKPRTEPLARWGTALHDKWLLPRYLDLDMQEVCRDLQAQGLPVQAEWFTPHSDFRMPLLGSFERDGVEIELRQAIEPWHVLGEEARAGGQARYVDSSCERVQVLLRGGTDRRHSLVCNGYRIPMQPTGVAGEWVAGVRYRAWQPTSCLHPTIPIDSPLRFDLYDEWNRRATAGATYHVVHPGGLSHETRPINSYEAEGRRCMRFQRAGHRAGNYQPKEAVILPERPCTLDLLRAGDKPGFP